MKRIIVTGLLLAGMSFGVYYTAWHDAGLLTINVSNYGLFGYQNAGIWPRGTSEFYIFGAGIWVGALQPDTANATLSTGIDSLATTIPVASTAGFDTVRGFLRLGSELVYYRHASGTSFDSCVRGFAASTPAAHSAGDTAKAMLARVSVGYDPSTGNSELAPGDLPNEPGYTDTLDRVYFSDNPADTALWPVRTPGGDALVVSNEDSYAITNDLAGATPLGVKIIQRGYAWYYHYYEDFIFFTYDIVNTSDADTLTTLFAGVCCDADIGDATDDLVGSDPSRDLGYAWDSNFYEAGWTHVPGYIGFDFLESPNGPSGQLGLTAFKILKNPGSSQPGVPDPANDLEALLTVAGYNHPTGEYHPVDSIFEATDVRFVQCTGPFALGPGDTGRVVIAVIYGADSTDLRGNSDLAQRLYDADFITHRAWVDSPNGGERLFGTCDIRWRDSSATGAPLLADIGCSRDRGRTWQDIVTGIPSTGSYAWNTTAYPDGARYLVRVTVHDTIAVGEDVSDSVFVVDNPGNGVPDVEYVSPQTGTVRGDCTVRWWALDPDGDTLSIDLFLSPDSTHWDTCIAQGLPNTGSHTFNSARFHNGTYYIRVRAHDADTLASDHSGAAIEFMNDHPPAGRLSHTIGQSDCISIQALLYDSSAINDHYYEITFEPILKNPARSDPRYRYDLRDITDDTLLLDDIPLDPTTDGQLNTFYSPVIDGFALAFDLRLDRSTFRYTDFYVHTNNSGYDGSPAMQGEDSLGTAPPLAGYEWCFRGSNYAVNWVRDATDSLTLDIYDSTAQASIPWGSPRGDNWFYGVGTSGPRRYNRVTHKAFYLNGEVFWFNRNNEMTIPPNTGDVWVVRSAGNRVPCNSNTWTFRSSLGLFDGRRTPFARRLTLDIAPSVTRGLLTIHLNPGTPEPSALSSLRLYSSSGRLVLALPCLPSADYQLPSSLPAGTYFARLQAGRESVTRKFTLVR